MLEKTGIATPEELKGKMPSSARRKQGPFAVIECFRQIPCDPCYHSCPQGAIAEFNDLNDLPVLDQEKCTGCGLCVTGCPGLAIFVLDYSGKEGEGLLKLAYEFLPLPEKGEKVLLLDRAGEVAGEGVVERVQNPDKFDRTALIWVKMPAGLLERVRNIRVVRDNG